MKKPDPQLSVQRARHLLEKDDATPSMYMGDIARLFECRVSGAAERKGVSHGYRRILFHLAHEDGVTQLQLVKLTHLTPPTISVSLAKMEKEGLVKRVADTKDMRGTRRDGARVL